MMSSKLDFLIDHVRVFSIIYSLFLLHFTYRLILEKSQQGHSQGGRWPHSVTSKTPLNPQMI